MKTEEELAGLSVPTVHLNGTSQKRLLEALQAAGDALYVARDLLRETAPNGRDYYPQGASAIRKAEDEHRSRVERILDVIEELGYLYGRVSS